MWIKGYPSYIIQKDQVNIVTGVNSSIYKDRKFYSRPVHKDVEKIKMD